MFRIRAGHYNYRAYCFQSAPCGGWYMLADDGKTVLLATNTIQDMRRTIDQWCWKATRK